MSRKVADISEFSEVNLIDGTFCCSGLQFHLFSSVLTGLIKRYPKVKVYCGEVLDISIQLLRHFQACPLPLSPLSTLRDICSTFSLKSCSKSQTELTAGSNINLAIEPKI